MKNLLLANCGSAMNRVALLEEGRLSQIFIEHSSGHSLAGNIFKGRVSNIVPGMQCAFVDIGLTKDLFLPLSDINLGHPKDFDPDTDNSQPGAEEDLQPTPSEPDVSISDVLKVGQEILVQVAKEPIGTKGPRGTTYLTLPGRYLVLMPDNHHLGISRRIEDIVEIARLQEIGLCIKPQNMGMIIRTVATGISKEDLQADLDFLLNLWDTIRKQAMQSPTPSLVHEESSLLLKVVRDIFCAQIDEFLIDSREQYEKICAYCRFFPDFLKQKIRYTQKPIFQEYSIEEEIQGALDEKVPLPSGGYLVIQETEALVSIDVNTGSFIGTTNLEETVFQTNQEAVVEIARQLRLRNLGGIIIVDFIDMIQTENRQTIYEQLLEECKKDKTKYNIKPITELGILQMTRQRVGKRLSSNLLERCPYCKGRGKIGSKDYVCNRIYRELKKLCSSEHHSDVVLATCHPEVAALLLEKEEFKFKQLEEETNTRIFIRGDSSFHYEQFKFS